MRLLIVDREAEVYRAALARSMPELEVIAATGYDEVEPELGEIDVLATMGVPLPRQHLTAELVRAMTRLRWVQCLISGPEHVRRALAERPDVLVTTAAGIHGPQMAEMALMHMLALSRRLPEVLRHQARREWQRVPQRMLEGRQVAIVGLGTIGRHLAGVCQALGMRVIGVSRSDHEVEAAERVVGLEELASLAGQLDFLVCVVPATPETTGLVGADLLEAMKPSAIVVNLGRGGVVDEPALAAAVAAGTIAGAGLDVFANEPLPADSPLWQLDNVIITPHLGGHHDRSAQQTLTVLEPNLRAFVAGRPEQMINVVAAPAAAR